MFGPVTLYLIASINFADQDRDRIGFHFSHNGTAVRLDGALSNAQLGRDPLVWKAFKYQFQNLDLPHS